MGVNETKHGPTAEAYLLNLNVLVLTPIDNTGTKLGSKLHFTHPELKEFLVTQQVKNFKLKFI